MKILYFCTVDPPPPPTDFNWALDFFKSVPAYLHPRMKGKDTNNLLLFADRDYGKLLPEFYDAVVVFLSERFLTNEKSLQCLSEISLRFSKIVWIDLYDNLTDELKKIARKYTKEILSTEEARTFLIENFRDPDAMAIEEAQRLSASIESEGYKYLDNTIAELGNKEKRNKRLAYVCYIGSFLFLLAALGWVVFRFICAKDGSYGNYCLLKRLISHAVSPENAYSVITHTINLAIVSGFVIAVSRFLYMLGKSFMVEAIRCSDRAHAIALGRLYLKLFGNKFKWSELRDVLQNWNIDGGSAFRNLDAKDIEVGVIEQLLANLKK